MWRPVEIVVVYTITRYYICTELPLKKTRRIPLLIFWSEDSGRGLDDLVLQTQFLVLSDLKSLVPESHTYPQTRTNDEGLSKSQHKDGKHQKDWRGWETQLSKVKSDGWF